jgi:hypothetical protein
MNLKKKDVVTARNMKEGKRQTEEEENTGFRVQ